MDYIILIIVAVAGIALGRYFALRLRAGQVRRNGGDLIAEQGRKKAENKNRILEFFKEKEQVVNNDIEKLLGVSDATATRYLDELEKDGKILQIGATGRAVHYVLR